MTIRAIVHEEDGGYWAEVPTMPGCVTEGETLDQLVAFLWEAIEGWSESRREFDKDSLIVTSKTYDLELCLPAKAAA